MGIAVSERKAWWLIEAMRDAQLETFGVELVEVLKEFKGSQSIQRWTVRRLLMVKLHRVRALACI